MNKNEMKTVVREAMYGNVRDMEAPDFALVGRVSEGLVFKSADGEYVVVKAIVKNEDFDGEFEVQAYEEEKALKEKAAKAKEASKSSKVRIVKPAKKKEA